MFSLARLVLGLSMVFALLPVQPALSQLTDKTQTNSANAGINKSFADEANASLAGDGRGDVFTPGSSLFIINRDPFRAVRRGRQVFQRKFTRDQGQGPRVNNSSSGDLNDPAQANLGAGLSDSCTGCHGRPRGSAGLGGDVVTRPDSRNVPHLFGLGIREMLADEITSDLRATRSSAISQAETSGTPVTLSLKSKGIGFGSIKALPTVRSTLPACRASIRTCGCGPFLRRAAHFRCANSSWAPSRTRWALKRSTPTYSPRITALAL